MIRGIPFAFMRVIDDRLKGRKFLRMQNPIDSGSLPIAHPAAGRRLTGTPLRIRLSEGIEDRVLVSIDAGDQLGIGLSVLGCIKVTGDDERDPFAHDLLRTFPDQTG